MAINDISLTAGMRNNLLALQVTAAALTQTQDRLSSGKKVNSALDNPTNFFSAQSHLQRASDLGDRKDGMSEGIQTVKAANAGITAITSLIQAAKGLASSALGTTDAAARKSYQGQFNTLRKQIDDLATDSGYKGTNLLKSATLTVQFNEKSDQSTLAIVGFDASTGAAGLSINAPIKDAASTTASATAGTALKTASETLATIKGSFDSAKLAQDALNAASTAIAAASEAATPAPDEANARIVDKAALAATAAGVAIGGIDSAAKDFFDAAALALTVAAASLRLDPPTADGTDETTAAGDLDAYTVVTTAAVAATILASTNATAAGVVATAAGDTGVGTALDTSATALGADDTAGISKALTDIGALTLADVVVVGDTSLTAAATAAADAAAAGTAVTNAGAGWGSNSAVGAAAINASSKELDDALSTLRTQSSALASNLSVVTTRQDFTSSMISTLTQGADNLTLADMNQEGANMLMLQTRQSLSTTALSLSSQAAQSVLKLF